MFAKESFMPDKREIQFWSIAQAAAFKMLGHQYRLEFQTRPTGALSPIFIFGHGALLDWQHLREEIHHLQREVSAELGKRRQAERSSQRPSVRRRQERPA